jgi:serine O-acetyltransferase
VNVEKSANQAACSVRSAGVNIFCDLYRYVPKGAESRGIEKVLRFLAAMCIHPGWRAVYNLRLSQLFRRLRLYPLSWLMYRWNMFAFSVDIHPAVSIGAGLWMPHPVGIVIARDAVIGCECTIYQNVTVGGRGNPPVIGNQAMIGAGACVLGPAKVGDNVAIGANSVVVDSVPDDVSVGGVPAKILGPRK